MKTRIVKIIICLLGIINISMAQTTGDYRSKQTGAWSDLASWQRYDGTVWKDSMGTPSSSSGVITIANFNTITTPGISIDQLVIQGAGTLIVTSGTLTIADGAGTDLNCMGILLGASDITCSPGSTLDWAGTFGGSGTVTINAGANFILSGAQHLLNDTKLINNYGTITWNSGVFYFAGTSNVLNNYGSFDIVTDADLSSFGNNTGSFNNMSAGIINKTGTIPEETSFSGALTFTNTGSINVNSGRLRFDLKSTNTGTAAIAAGASMNFGSTQGNTANFNAGTVISGAGSLNFDGATAFINTGTITVKNISISSGTVTITPPITFNNTGGLNLTSAGVLNSSGDINFNTGTAFNWLGGTNAGTGIMNINTGAVSTISSPNQLFLSDTKTINNYGTTSWISGTFYYSGGSPVMNNYGTFNIVTDADLTNFQPSTGSFNNKSTGIINKIGSPDNETSFSGISQFTNSGTINVNSSKLKFDLNTTNTGTANIAFAASINFPSNTVNFNAGTSITGEGTLNFNGTAALINTGSFTVKNISISAGTVTITPAIVFTTSGGLNLSGGTLNTSGDINFNSGTTFNWLGGTNGGTGIMNINAGAAFVLDAGQLYFTDTKTINNYGTTTWNNGTLYYHGGSPIINNYSSFNISTDADLTTLSPSTGSFNNKSTGIINKTGSAQDETSFSGISQFTNAGIINVNSSRLRFNINTVNTGTATIAFAAAMNFSTGSTANFNAGTAIAGEGTLTFDGATTLINAGLVTVKNMNISSATVSITPAITFTTNGGLTLSGGILNTTGDINLNSGTTFNWTGGTNGGTGIMNINDGTSFALDGGDHNLADTKTINSYGTVTWTNGRIIYYNSAPVLNNYGTFNISTDADVTNFQPSTGSFNNKSPGIINKIGSPLDETSFSNINSFTNEGTININSSILSLNIAGAHTGTYNIDFGAELRGSIIMPFTGPTITNNGGITLTGLSFNGSAIQYLNGEGYINVLTINNTIGVMQTEAQTIKTNITVSDNSKLTVYRDLIITKQ